MRQFVLLAKFPKHVSRSPDAVEDAERRIMRRLEEECPQVEPQTSYGIVGPWDSLDIFRAPDEETAGRVEQIVRDEANAHTALWGAIDWGSFRDLLEKQRDATDEQEVDEASWESFPASDPPAWTLGKER